MSNRSAFQFKQFLVYQDLCAMKVSLDACLLGAMCDTHRARRILDIGTGTGLLSLMLAQRSCANIDAVELDESAVKQATENIANSPYAQTISVINSSIQAFQIHSQPANYDLIICNPPFFSQHLNSENAQRNLARHNDHLSFAELTSCMSYLLNSGGLIWVLLPQHEHPSFSQHANHHGLFLQKHIDIIPRANKPSKLGIWVYGKQATNNPSQSEVTVYEQMSNQYTQQFKALLRDYYLKL